jgi:hypothetical protein
MMGSRGSSGWWVGAFALALTLLLVTNPAHARNVPGSVSAVQSRIDQAVAASLIDTTVTAARRAALFESCESFLKDEDPATKALRNPCEWGVSVGGGARYIEGSPDGFEFDFTSGFGNVAVAHKLTPTTTIVVALIAEGGSGDLDYNDGTLENIGVGGLAGAIFKLNDVLDFSVLGGGEWLNYETTRSSGTYSGEYDAVRYIVDTNLRGTYDAAAFFVEYGAGLRFIKQDNDNYTEYSHGDSFASVPDSGFTVLTGIGDLKLGTRMPGFVPYVEGTGYVNIIDDTDFAASFGGLTPEDQTAYGRLGVGADIDVLTGKLSLRTGAFADGDGFQGADGGFQFAKAF